MLNSQQYVHAVLPPVCTLCKNVPDCAASADACIFDAQRAGTKSDGSAFDACTPVVSALPSTSCCKMIVADPLLQIILVHYVSMSNVVLLCCFHDAIQAVS